MDGDSSTRRLVEPPFLGTLPKHWTFEQLRRVAMIDPSNVDKKAVEGQAPVRLCNYVDVYKNERITSDIAFMEATATGDQIKKFGLRCEDVLITKDSETPGDIGVPAVIAEEIRDLVCGYHLALVRPRSGRLFGPFLQRALQAMPVSAHFQSSATGVTRFGLTRMDLGTALIPIPPLPEQIAIANFLDRETARIDRLIGKKTRQIALLEEKRSAIVSQVVTRGLEPRCPMKDSHVEWLGLVPKHWQVIRLRFLCSVHTGDKDTVDAEDDGAYPFFVRAQKVERIGTYTFDGEAVLTAGDGVGVGKVFHYYVGKLDFHQRVYLLSNFKLISGKFLFHVLRENFFKVALEGNAKSTVDSLRMPLFLNFYVPVPPADEQWAIERYIDESLTLIDAQVERVDRSVALMRECRAAVITSAVTGRIQVAA